MAKKTFYVAEKKGEEIQKNVLAIKMECGKIFIDKFLKWTEIFM